jgi:predicted DsbA family dithiol-disulfide isomerase
MKIEIWSDVACPFCYIGERHLELAVESFDHRDDVEVVPRAFELDPTATKHEHRPMDEALAAKFGTTPAQVAAMQRGIAERAHAVGLEFDTTNASVTNTFDAHRLVHLAREQGLDRELLHALMRGYFAHGLKAGDPEALVAVATGVGLDEARVREVLAGDEFTSAVKADEAKARSIGVQGVPFFLIDGKYAVQGAQPVEAFTQALDEVWAKENPIQVLGGDSADAAVCTDDSCALPQPSKS